MRNWFIESTRVLAPILIVGFGIFGFVVFGKRPDVKNAIPVPAIPAVQTVAAVESPGNLTIEVEGVAAPSRQLTLSAEVEGRIVKKAAQSRAGKFVSEGDVLLQIDPVDYQLEVDRLTAQVSQSRAELNAIDVQINSNEKLVSIGSEEHAMNLRELDRAEELAKRKAFNESQVDAVRGAELASRRFVQTLRNEGALLVERKQAQVAGLALAEAQLAGAVEDLQRTKIKSPFDGMVVTDSFELNTFVKRGDALLKISDTRHLEITTSLTVDELYWIWMDSGLLTGNGEKSVKKRMEIPQTDVEAVFDLHGTKYAWKGKLSRYEGSGLDAQTRTVPCRVLVENPTDVRVMKKQETSATVAGTSDTGNPTLPSMYVGMYLTIRIPLHSPVPLLEVPTVALRPGNHVWVVRGGKLKVIDADVLRQEPNKVYLRRSESGLVPGDRVVTSPLSYAKDGLPVEEVVVDSGVIKEGVTEDREPGRNESTAEVSDR